MAETKVRDVTADIIAGLERRRAAYVRLGRSTEAVDAKLKALRGEGDAGAATAAVPAADAQSGTTGAVGATGGTAGATGGTAGATGATGVTGDGATGSTGSSGDTGATGADENRQEEDPNVEKKIADKPHERAVPGASGDASASPAQVHARKVANAQRKAGN